MRTALVLVLLASPLHAACQDEEVFSCQIGAKRVEVCASQGVITYRFGPEGKPELTLSEPLETIAFTPWPGIGSGLWETVAFRNDGYTYEIGTSVERDPDSTEPRAGGVRVMQGDVALAELTCDRGTATPMDLLYDLKDGIGQCWDMEAQAWGDACN